MTMEETYAIIVTDDGTVMERQLADHYQGAELEASLSSSDVVVDGGVRTATLTRPMTVSTSDKHYDFSLGSMRVLHAFGQGWPSHHSEFGSVTVTVVEAPQAEA